MRQLILLTVGLWLLPTLAVAQGDTASGVAGDAGFQEPGWFSVVEDGQPPASPLESTFAAEAGGFRVATRPAQAYFPLASTARAETAFRQVSGNYTIAATFRESFDGSTHLYGPAVAAERPDEGGATTYLYCAASGAGTFVVGGVGPGLKPFQLNGPKPQPHPAVHRAPAPGASVEQEIALSVTDGTVRCAINGTVVASYDTSVVVGPSRLAGTDGVYGLRFASDTQVFVSNLTVIQAGDAMPH